ncbi:MAG: hypothetical protein RLZZ605_1452 [Bacteroidota bacterium]|jgi:hypothetical protein
MSKLREKFKKARIDFPLIHSPTEKDILEYENTLTKREQIADDFSVKFAMHISTHCNCELGNDTRSYTELLQIFKDKYYE